MTKHVVIYRQALVNDNDINGNDNNHNQKPSDSVVQIISRATWAFGIKKIESPQLFFSGPDLIFLISFMHQVLK